MTLHEKFIMIKEMKENGELIIEDKGIHGQLFDQYTVEYHSIKEQHIQLSIDQSSLIRIPVENNTDIVLKLPISSNLADLISESESLGSVTNGLSFFGSIRARLKRFLSNRQN